MRSGYKIRVEWAFEEWGISASGVAFAAKINWAWVDTLARF